MTILVGGVVLGFFAYLESSGGQEAAKAPKWHFWYENCIKK